MGCIEHFLSICNHDRIKWGMQSNTSKTKKTRKAVENSTTAASDQVTPLAEDAPKARKKSTAAASATTEGASPVKKHRRATKSVPENLMIEELSAEQLSDALPLAETASPESHLQLTVPNNPYRATYEEIATRAYLYWVERGYQDGDPVADWLRAESELSAR